MTQPQLDHAITTLHHGGVIAYPTEAVWGLGCDPFDQAAVTRLLALKQREVAKGLILVAADVAQFDHIADWDALTDVQSDAVLASWPGPHTWIVPATTRAPRWITGDHDSIALRVSAHPLVVALCKGFGGAIVSTSANRAGHAPPRTLNELNPDLRSAVDAIVAGETSGLSRPTPIRDARSGAALRD